jgi:hypothetical protein
MTSIGLRPAVLFFSLTGVNTAASISARKRPGHENITLCEVVHIRQRKSMLS